jgi:hypothetical protein
MASREAETGPAEALRAIDSTGGVDGFHLPLPSNPITEGSGKKFGGRARVESKKDFSLFTLDYAFRSVGGRKAAIELARLASGNDDRLRGIVDGYDALTPGQRKHKPKLLESLCIASSVDPSEFLGICTAIAHRFQLDTSAILASIELEQVVAAGLEQAKRPEGVQDRKLIYEHSTFLPTKGPGVAVQINNSPQQLGTQLPEFRSLSEIALTAISRTALPPAPKEKEDEFIESEPLD